MTARRWNPIRLTSGLHPLGRLDEQIDQAFDALLTSPWLSETAGWMPQVDIYEAPDAFLIEADLPGVPPENLQVQIDGDTVTIRGSRSETRRDEPSHGVVRIERSRGSFCRTLTVSQPIDDQGIQVSHDQGVFHIRIPKQREQPEP